MAEYSRAELEQMMERWLQANRNAEQEGNWAKYLGPMYTDDAEYRWNIGPNEEFVARSRKQIEEWALGVQMQGFEQWRYPYDRILIDEKQDFFQILNSNEVPFLPSLRIQQDSFNARSFSPSNICF